MRTTLLIATLLLLVASSARAESAWEGTWVNESGERRTLAASGGLFALDLELPSVDKRAFHLTGPVAIGDTLRLAGRLEGTAGIRGALGGDKASGGRHTASLEGDLDRATSTADVKLTVDGRGQSEKWSRGGLTILKLESDGSELSRPFDAKRSRTGLVVKYRVNGSALPLTARVVPAKNHPNASFYEGADVFRRELGTVAPGEHELTWDGRDTTSARRIALGGDYELVLQAGTVHAERTFTVETARFETIGSDWPAIKDEAGIGSRPAWNPTRHLQDLVAVIALTAKVTHAQPAFRFEGVRLATSPEEVRRHASEAGSLLISTHGNVGRLTVHGDGMVKRYTPSEVFKRDLKDVHFAFVSACCSGGTYDEVTKTTKTSVVDQMIAAGCDVAVGFTFPADMQEADDFEKVTMALAARGCPITKAAIDAGKAIETAKLQYDRGTVSKPLRGEEMIVRKCAAGISPEKETLWPPRYGCSTN